MIESEIIFDATTQRFYIVVVEIETNQQSKRLLDEEILAECFMHSALREQMAAELARILEELKTIEEGT